MDLDMHNEMLRLLSEFQSTLNTFAKSAASYQVVRTAASRNAATSITRPSSLFVLDFSANPPTKAHFKIAQASIPPNETSRLLLLLATQNADKAPKPAPFHERLVMMSIFAHELLSTPSLASVKLTIEIGVIKHARFLDKSTELEKHYPEEEQVYLIGYDTLTRLLDTKYYPTAYTLEPLANFFQKNRIKCTYRPDDGWGVREEQDAYMNAVRNGEKEFEGAKKEWAERIEMVENNVGFPVSSTKIREAAKKQDERLLESYLTPGVKDWILERKLYSEES